MLHSIEPAHYQ